MTEWNEAADYQKGERVRVGARKRAGIIHTYTVTCNGVELYGIRWDPPIQRIGSRRPDDCDTYCVLALIESTVLPLDLG